MRKLLAYLFRLVLLHSPLKKFYPLFQKRLFGPTRLFNGVTVAANYGKGRIKLKLADWIQHHLYFMGEYDSPSMRWLEANLKPGAVVLDIGANIGVFTLKMAELVGDSGKVLAFEPHPTNASQLLENISLNNLENCSLYQIALGDRTCLVQMPAVDPLNQGMAKITDNGHSAAIKVLCQRGDDLTEIRSLDRLDCIKIDTEGFELAVLAGIEQTIAKHNPVLLIEFDNQLGLDLKPLLNWIVDHNYKISTVDVPEKVLDKSVLLQATFSANLVLSR